MKSLKFYLYCFTKLYCFPVFVLISYISVLFSCVRINLLYQYCFLVFVPISCIIRTDPLYRYYLPILRHMIVISTVIMTPACYYLTHDSCMLSPDIYLISLITCPWYMTTWPAIIIFVGILSWYPVLYTVTCILNTYVLLNLSCSCHSHKLIIT